MVLLDTLVSVGGRVTRHHGALPLSAGVCCDARMSEVTAAIFRASSRAGPRY